MLTAHCSGPVRKGTLLSPQKGTWSAVNWSPWLFCRGHFRQGDGGLGAVARCRPNRLGFCRGYLVGLVGKQIWVRRFLITVIWGTLLPTSYSRTCSRCRVDQGFVLAFYFSFLLVKSLKPTNRGHETSKSERNCFAKNRRVDLTG